MWRGALLILPVTLRRSSLHGDGNAAMQFVAVLLASDSHQQVKTGVDQGGLRCCQSASHAHEGTRKKRMMLALSSWMQTRQSFALQKSYGMKSLCEGRLRIRSWMREYDNMYTSLSARHMRGMNDILRGERENKNEKEKKKER